MRRKLSHAEENISYHFGLIISIKPWQWWGKDSKRSVGSSLSIVFKLNKLIFRLAARILNISNIKRELWLSSLFVRFSEVSLKALKTISYQNSFGIFSTPSASTEHFWGKEFWLLSNYSLLVFPKNRVTVEWVFTRKRFNFSIFSF